jgi:hypothetical protein
MVVDPIGDAECIRPRTDRPASAHLWIADEIGRLRDNFIRSDRGALAIGRIVRVMRELILDLQQALGLLGFGTGDIDRVLLLLAFCADLLQGVAKARQPTANAACVDRRNGTAGAEVFRPAEV